MVSYIRFSASSLVISLAVFLPLIVQPICAKPSPSTTNWILEQGVGEVDFPVSTKNTEARTAFNLGFAMLEDFEYPEATNQFQLAQRLDPHFAMAYWGEAMTHLRILWEWLDYDAAKAIYQKLDKQTDLTQLKPIESALIKATRTLINQGNKSLPGYKKQSSLMAYRQAMQQVWQEFPDNPDVATMYAHAVLGTRYGVHDYANNDRAGKPLLALYEQYPDHPGLNHLILHSYENARQTYRARLASQRYAKIAPGAIHSLHMPSHHYYYQGDWHNVAKTNILAWQQSLAKQRAMNLSDDYLEYHGNLWKIYADLQLQQPEQALAAINEVLTKQETRARNHYLVTAIAHFLLHTYAEPSMQDLYRQAAAIKVNESLLPSYDLTGYIYAKATTTPQLSHQQIKVALSELKEKVLPTLNQQSPSVQEQVTIVLNQLEALALISAGQSDEGIEVLAAMAKAEDDSYREHGVQYIIVKPSHELLADVLLQHHAYGEALYHYQRELLNNPGRLLSVDGAAKAAVLAGRLPSPHAFTSCNSASNVFSLTGPKCIKQ